MPKRYEGMAYWEIVSRQMGILTKNEQVKLKNSKIIVIGCGGIGGAAIEMLARMGVGNLRIIDKDSFDLSNINRQIMSTFHSVGKSKIEVTYQTLKAINPFLKIDAIEEELNEDNIKRIIEGSDVVVDALDNLFSRVLVSRCSLEFGIPFIHGAIYGTMGQISVFTDKTPTYEELFKLPSSGKELSDEIIEKLRNLNEEVPPVIAPVPNIVGCIQSFEVLKQITDRGKPIIAPNVLMFDLLKEEPFSLVTL
ncbi:MAG: HesA/MoeB/ThiF family protein [Euryarchaeota archaeon]|nr:HesA/MoeB/ThiF family protein [Euryarchaeota archaeon]